jgi:hypothetical protein
MTDRPESTTTLLFQIRASSWSSWRTIVGIVVGFRVGLV